MAQDIEDCSSASESSSGTASVTAPSERNYVERLKRKIMDQLELCITGAHIRLEGCQGNQLKATAGLIFDSFSIHPAISEGGLRQRVEMTLSAYAYYADPEVQLADVPPEAFVVSNASPSCWATRISGRRFVDWKGLQLQLEGQHLQVQWRREQLRCCLQLAQQAKGERIKSDDFADAREEEEFLECEDVAVQSWSRWLRDKWRGPPNSELGEELPEGVSESDRAILLEDGAGNGLAGADSAREKLEVSLMLPKVTLLAMDSSLQFSAGVMLQLDIVELDDWNFHGELLEFGVLELSKSADQFSVVRFEGADVPATLTITRREAKGEHFGGRGLISPMIQ